MNILDNDSHTPTSLARSNNHTSIAYFLKYFEKSHHIDLNHPNLQIQKTKVWRNFILTFKKRYIDYFKSYGQLGGFFFGFLGMPILFFILTEFSFLFTLLNFIVYFILAYKLASYLFAKDHYHTICVGWFFGTLQMSFYTYFFKIYFGPYS